MNVRMFGRERSNSEKNCHRTSGGGSFRKTENCDNDRRQFKQRNRLTRARNNIADSGILATYGDRNETDEYTAGQNRANGVAIRMAIQ